MDAAAEEISPSLCGQGTAAVAAAAAAYVNEMSSLLLLRSEAEKISSLIRQSPQKEGEMASNGGFCFCAFLDIAPLKGEAPLFLPFIVASPPARRDNVLLLHLVTSSTEKVSNKGPIDDLDILNNTLATAPPTIPPRSMSNRDRSAALPWSGGEH